MGCSITEVSSPALLSYCFCMLLIKTTKTGSKTRRIFGKNYVYSVPFASRSYSILIITLAWQISASTVKPQWCAAVWYPASPPQSRVTLARVRRIIFPILSVPLNGVYSLESIIITSASSRVIPRLSCLCLFVLLSWPLEHCCFRSWLSGCMPPHVHITQTGRFEQLFWDFRLFWLLIIL